MCSVHELSEAVLRAVETEEVRCWRREAFPHASRWDDGPCWKLALAIAEADGHRGDLVWVQSRYHCMYRRDGWLIDGHGMRPESKHSEDMVPDEDMPPYDAPFPTTLADSIKAQLREVYA